MQKSYTLKEKNPTLTTQPNQITINAILNFSKALEVIKTKKTKIELILN